MTWTRQEQKKLRALRDRRERRAQALFLAEGVRVLEEARRHGAQPRQLVYDETVSDRARDLVDHWTANGVAVASIDSSALEQIAEAKTPQGILASFPLPSADDSAEVLKIARNILVCDGVSDPGNLGTLLRSALAFDFDLAIVLEDAADPWSPKVVRSSAGAIFGMRVLRSTRESLVAELDDDDALIVAAGQVPAEKTKRAAPVDGQRCFLAVGSEGEGVSPELQDKATAHWRIDMNDQVESLNAGVAGSILLKELRDLRR